MSLGEAMTELNRRTKIAGLEGFEMRRQMERLEEIGIALSIDANDRVETLSKSGEQLIAVPKML
jgi:hypothetical protein